MHSAKSFLILLLLGVTAAAQTSALNYEHRVVRATEQIERIKTDSEYAEEGIPYIKRLLPRTEAVQTQTGRVEVDNAWLWTLLESYEKETDKQLRLSILNEAAGRLKSLDEHLQRGQGKPAAADDSQEQRERLRQILARAEYQERQDTAVGKFIKRVLAKIREMLFQIRQALFDLVERVFGAGRTGGIVPQLIVLVVIAAALILAVRMISRFRPPPKRRKKRVVLGEEVEADATPRDLADAAMAAARAGDFRLAIRKLYVSLLYELADRRIIELEESATNREYLARVAAHSSLVPPMSHLTDQFDYFWYGMFPSSNEDFSKCLSIYREAMRNAQTIASVAPAQ